MSIISQPDWAGFEKHFADMPSHQVPDSIPANVREWDRFRSIYESCRAWTSGAMPDQSFRGMSVQDHIDMFGELMPDGRWKWKKSPFEVAYDIFNRHNNGEYMKRYSVDLRMVELTYRAWQGNLSSQQLLTLPRCLENYSEDFIGNCGTITNDGIDGSCYWLEIRNECSGNKKKFCFDQDIWMNNFVGDRFCVNNVQPW